MYVFITILILIASILMVLVVLVQNSKGGGLSAGFASSNQIMGVSRTTDFLEKTTWTLAGVILFLCVLSVVFLPKASNERQSNIKELVNESVMVDPNLVAPNADMPQKEGE